MLTSKQIEKSQLNAVEKNGAKIIKLKKPAASPAPEKTAENLPVADQPLTEKKEEKTTKKLLPPRDKFNSGYLKGRDNDPL